jgi:glycosyltransferase involved in cell wall biosynthesis
MKVSVLLTAYNHEGFIAQAIDSVLMQEADFDYEVVIGEDCSTDDTRDIVIDLGRRHPDKIRLMLTEKNSGECFNVAQSLRACRGQYVAMLDGDDYWTSAHKLQRQVDYLDGHPGFSICCHNAAAFYEDGGGEAYDFNPPGQKEVSTLDDLWAGNFIATCSVMFRRDLVSHIPGWFYSLRWADWPLYILCARHGSIGYINEIMAAYRIHKGGAWSGLGEIAQLEQVIEFYEKMNENLDFVCDETIKVMLSEHYYVLSGAYERNGDLDKARIYLRKTISENSLAQGSKAQLREHV